jgi:hypothetical protein
MEPLEPDDFVALRRDIESHPRLCGYYLVKHVSIADLRARDCTDEDIAEEVFRYFDDHPWPSIDDRPETDQKWEDYLADESTARRQLIEYLVGGGSIGHLEVTIPEPRAAEYVERFDALFPEPKIYYLGMGFGDRKYVFSGGVVIVSSNTAGCLWVVEND